MSTILEDDIMLSPDAWVRKITDMPMPSQPLPGSEAEAGVLKAEKRLVLCVQRVRKRDITAAVADVAKEVRSVRRALLNQKYPVDFIRDEADPIGLFCMAAKAVEMALTVTAGRPKPASDALDGLAQVNLDHSHLVVGEDDARLRLMAALVAAVTELLARRGSESVYAHP